MARVWRHGRADSALAPSQTKCPSLEASASDVAATSVHVAAGGLCAAYDSVVRLFHIVASANSSSNTALTVREPQPASEVSGIIVRALAEAVRRFDVTPTTLLEADAERLSTRNPLDVRLPLPRFGQLLQRASTLTAEPAIALLCGVDASEGAFDLLAPLVTHVASLRHAIHEMNQFSALAFEGSYTRLTENAGVARLRCEFPRLCGVADCAVAEFLVGSLLRLFRGFGGTQRDLYAAFFEHSRPPFAHAYTRAFQGRERFSQAFTGLEFAARVLDRPHLHANAELQCAVHLLAEQRLERLTRPIGFVERLNAYLASHPGPGLPDMETVARDFDMSVRSLRRRMTDNGLSFRALTQTLQSQHACRLLRNPKSTVQDVAGALGFADTGAFHRAFHRWTGMSPWDYRHSLPAFRVAETTS